MAEAVGRMLQAALEPGVRIAGIEALTEERSVWRCSLEGDSGLPQSVIVRVRREVGGWRTDPSYLRNDYAATEFLQARCPAVTARIIAADIDAGLYVTEDLGTGPSLGDLLAGTTQPEAAKGLLAFAVVLGRMHAATAGLEGEYYRRRRLLGPADPIRYRTCLGEFFLEDAARGILNARVSGQTAPRQAQVEMRAILAALARPEGFLALSNGDPCPYNCIVSNGAARLFDFELAGYRHAMLDVAYLHLGFHWCYRPGRVPPEVLSEAETAYRLEASAGIPAALDESVYQRALTAAAAAWAMLSASMVVVHLDGGGALEAAGAARHVATVREYLAMSGRGACFPALSHWISELVTAFERDGPRCERGLYRSFD